MKNKPALKNDFMKIEIHLAASEKLTESILCDMERKAFRQALITNFMKLASTFGVVLIAVLMLQAGEDIIAGLLNSVFPDVLIFSQLTSDSANGIVSIGISLRHFLPLVFKSALHLSQSILLPAFFLLLASSKIEKNLNKPKMRVN